MRGRKVGSSEITISDMQKIVELTEQGESRGNIAKAIGRCNMTVYYWQKKLIK